MAFHLEHDDERRIFESVFPSFRIGKSVKSPFREDKHPSCRICKRKDGRIFLHDYATGESLSCVDLLMRIYNCDFVGAIQFIESRYGIFDKENRIFGYEDIEQKSNVIFQYDYVTMHYQECHLEWFQKFSIKPKIANANDVIAVENYSILYDGCYVKIEPEKNNPLFAIRFPNGEQGELKTKFYSPLSKGSAKWKNLNVHGTDVFGLRLSQLMKHNPFLFICAGIKDALILHSMGFPAISFNSETLMPSESVIQSLTGFEYNIPEGTFIIVYDWDKTGLEQGEKLRNHLNRSPKSGWKVKNINLSTLMKSDFVKDTKDIGDLAEKNICTVLIALESIIPPK